MKIKEKFKRYENTEKIGDPYTRSVELFEYEVPRMKKILVFVLNFIT